MSQPSKLSPLRIRLPYRTVDEFVERYGANVARGGVFVATKSVKPEGTPVAFEFVLEDGARVLLGEGTVQRLHADAAGNRAGMTIRFLRLDLASKNLVDRIVELRAPPSAQHQQQPLAPPRRSREITIPFPDQPAPAHDDRIVLGVDLGSAHCRAAVLLDDRCRTIPLGPDEALFLPSVVALDEHGRLVVGTEAQAILRTDPSAAAADLKRGLGPRREEAGDWLPRSVALRERELPLVTLLGALLGHIREASTRSLGVPVRRVVLCVPGFFGVRERESLAEAAAAAGLEVVRIVNEPSAVALTYGRGRGLARKRLLVYLLGGGSFSASVVELTGDDVEVLSIGGDPALGGIDFDQRLAMHLAAGLDDEARAFLRQSPLSSRLILEAAENAKKALARDTHATVWVPHAAVRQDGQTVDLRAELTRDELEQLTAELVDRTLQVTTDVLRAAGVGLSGLDEVLAVGGQSQAPWLVARVERALGRPVCRDAVSPVAAVSEGAAILGHSIVQRGKGKQSASLSEVLSVPIGVARRDGTTFHVLERNTRLPAEKSVPITLPEDSALELVLVQGHGGPKLDPADLLGVFRVDAARKGEWTVTFSLSVDATLRVTASGPLGETGGQLEIGVPSGSQLEALLARAPLEGDQVAPPVPRGLLGGLRRWFGRTS